MKASRLTGSPVVAVTGAGRGIGKATARALLASGARVAIGDIDEPAARSAAAELANGTVATKVDVSSPESVAAFLEFTEGELGPLGVLINNAGIMPTGPFLAEPHDVSLAQLHINVMGCLNGMRAALPGMLQRQRGHIINVASIAGKSAVPGALTYAASKAAVISATESARAEFAGSGIDFTCVLPSFTETELISGLRGARGVKNARPEDVADAIVAAIAHPCAQVYVPAHLGAAIRLPLLPHRLRTALMRWSGADRAFLDFDHDVRAAYHGRVAELAAGGAGDAMDRHGGSVEPGSGERSGMPTLETEPAHDSRVGARR